MSPLQVRNEFLYDESSRFLQRWHRETFGPDADAIDIDLIGRCHHCLIPLYGMEATSSSDKATTLLRQVCDSLEIPAILWRHNQACDRVVRVTRLGLPPVVGDEEFGKDLIGALRAEHASICRNRRST